MNQIAGVDGFSLMNNLRLVIIVVIFFNRISEFLEKVKRKDILAVKPSDDSSREEQHAPGAVDDFPGMEEPLGQEESKGGESAAEPEVEIEGPPAVNYEEIEADLKAVRDEVTAKIEELISKVGAVEKEVLKKIEDVIDVKIQEASDKINDGISEAVRTQIELINPVPEEIEEETSEGDAEGSAEFEKKKKRDLKALVKGRDILEKLHLFIRYHLDAFEILPFDESKTVAEEKKDVRVDGKESIGADTSTGEIEEKISEGDAGESVSPARLFLQRFLSVIIPSTGKPKESVEEVEFKFKEEKKESDLEAPVEDRDILEEPAGSLQMDEDAFDILPSEESETVAGEKKERDLEVLSEVKEDVKIDEKEPVEADTSTGEIEEKISEVDVGESDDFDIEKLLEEEPVGMSSTEESMEVKEEVEFKKEKEEDLELPAEETVAHEGIDEKEIDTVTPPGEIKEKELEAAKGEGAEEKKQSTGDDIQDFLEELGTPPSEKDLKSEKNDTD